MYCVMRSVFAKGTPILRIQGTGGDAEYGCPSRESQQVDQFEAMRTRKKNWSYHIEIPIDGLLSFGERKLPKGCIRSCGFR